jgi:hypothetical protein
MKRKAADGIDGGGTAMPRLRSKDDEKMRFQRNRKKAAGACGPVSVCGDQQQDSRNARSLFRPYKRGSGGICGTV